MRNLITEILAIVIVGLGMISFVNACDEEQQVVVYGLEDVTVFETAGTTFVVCNASGISEDGNVTIEESQLEDLKALVEESKSSESYVDAHDNNILSNCFNGVLNYIGRINLNFGVINDDVDYDSDYENDYGEEDGNNYSDDWYDFSDDEFDFGCNCDDDDLGEDENHEINDDRVSNDDLNNKEPNEDVSEDLDDSNFEDKDSEISDNDNIASDSEIEDENTGDNQNSGDEFVDDENSDFESDNFLANEDSDMVFENTDIEGSENVDSDIELDYLSSSDGESGITE